MSSHLTPDQLGRLEAALRDRRQALRERMAKQLGGLSRAEHAREVLLQDGDDAPQRDADREIDLALTDKDGTEFAAVERALSRLAAGGYGECADCGEPIAFERLELEPQAARCVACETARERLGPRPASM